VVFYCWIAEPYTPYYYKSSDDSYTIMNPSGVLLAKEHDKISSVASHNSYAFPFKVPWSFCLQTRLLQNQVLDFGEQLAFGVRTFLLDIYVSADKTIKFSHGILLGIGLSFVRDWIPFLKEIRMFLDVNKNEVITLILESEVGNHDKIMQDIQKVGFTKDDIYIPENKAIDWDTRQYMINTGKRLLIFSDNNLDVGQYIMSTYRILENHYDAKECLHRGFKRLKIPPECEHFSDTTKPLMECLRENPAANHKFHEYDNRHNRTILFLMNHFPADRALNMLKIFDVSVLEDQDTADLIMGYYSLYNSYESIKNRIKACYCTFEFGEKKTPLAEKKKFLLKRYPSVIAIDFVGLGGQKGVLKIVEEITSGYFEEPECGDVYVDNSNIASKDEL
jgi:hypothetical protein